MLVGIHRIILRQGAVAEEFERFMADEVFPATADNAPVNRGGRSAIKSQHLLRTDGEYLWLIKGSGAIGEPTVSLDDALQAKLDSFATQAFVMATVIASFDAD